MTVLPARMPADPGAFLLGKDQRGNQVHLPENGGIGESTAGGGISAAAQAAVVAEDPL